MTLDGWLLTSNSFLFIFSALAVVASIAVFLLTRASERAKDRELAQYQAQAAQTVAQANSTAELAKSDAAKANERAAALEKEAAEARVEQGRLAVQLQQATAEVLRLRKGVARHVELAQLEKLRSLLNLPGLHVQLIAETNPEAIIFRDELAGALRDVGFVVDAVFENTAIGNTGIEVYGGPDTDVSKRIAQALLDVFGAPVSFSPNVSDVTTIRIAMKPSTL